MISLGHISQSWGGSFEVSLWLVSVIYPRLGEARSNLEGKSVEGWVISHLF